SCSWSWTGTGRRTEVRLCRPAHAASRLPMEAHSLQAAGTRLDTQAVPRSCAGTGRGGFAGNHDRRRAGNRSPLTKGRSIGVLKRGNSGGLRPGILPSPRPFRPGGKNAHFLRRQFVAAHATGSGSNGVLVL